MENLKYRCCFCNQLIQSSQYDPCDLNILINVDKPKDKQDNQTFYCHALCFKQKLHEKIQGYMIVHEVDDEQ
jgi:hypothetical protein